MLRISPVCRLPGGFFCCVFASRLCCRFDAFARNRKDRKNRLTASLPVAVGLRFARHRAAGKAARRSGKPGLRKIGRGWFDFTFAGIHYLCVSKSERECL